MACNDADNDDLGAITPIDDTTTVNNAELDYAYTKSSTSNYNMGDPAQIQMVLTSLKAWENNNIDEAVQYFGDTVELYFDNYYAKLPKDSLKQFFTQTRGDFDSVKIVMHDWETVKSTNDNNEWVSLWYTEIIKPKNGKLDSLAMMDDIKVRDGKIVEINQYTRRFAKKN
jgi:hypothetical protein